MEISLQPAGKIEYLLEHLAATVARQSDQALQEQLGIGLAQFKILMALGWNPHVPQRKLAQSLGQTEASISRQIKLLHEKGMLLTTVNPAERREHLTEVTSKGFKITEAARAIITQHHALILKSLTEKQIQALADTLVLLHAQTCRPGNPHACDHPLGV